MTHSVHRHRFARIAVGYGMGWRCLLTVVLMLGVFFVNRSSQAAVPDAKVARASVEATIYRAGELTPDGARPPRGGAIVDGRVTYHLARAGTVPRQLWLLNYAEALVEEPLQLDEVQLAAYLDGPFKPGQLQVSAVTADDRPMVFARDGPRRDVLVEVPAGVTRITVAYRVIVPRRYWPFGCSRGRCSLDGAIAPLPSVPAIGGEYLPPDGRVIDPVVWDVTRAEVARSHQPTWYVGQTPFSRPWSDVPSGDVVVVANTSASSLGLSAYPSIFWGSGWRFTTDVVAGTYVTVIDAQPRPPGRYPHESFTQLHRDRVGRALAIAGETLDLTARRGVTRTPDGAMVVMVGPLRSQIASAHPGAVVISDHAYELFPSERLTKFHDVVIARACLEQQLYGWFVGRHDPSTDLWLSSMVGFALTREWERERDLRDEFAQDILAKLTFMPAVDRFLYSGQASFSSAYFRGSEDDFVLRDHPLLFSHELPTGRRIHEKLSDFMADDAMARMYAQLLTEPSADPRRTAEQAYGYRLHWFFDQWLGRYPDVDYLLDRVKSEQVGEGYRHTIDIVRDGDEPVIEPVQVYAIERGGTTHYLVWNGDVITADDVASTDHRRVRHRFTLYTERPLKVVRIDPRARLHETSRLGLDRDTPANNFDPVFNNRRPAKVRFLYTGLGFDVAASELASAMTPAARFNAFSGFAAFAGGLQRDLRRLGTVHVFTDRETLAGAGGGVNFYFLEKVNRQRRRLRVRLAGALSALKGANLDTRGGIGLSESVSITDDTRRFSFWPEQGQRLSLSATLQQVIVDGEITRQNIRTGADWQRLWRLAHGHVLAHSLEVSMMAPLASEPEFRSLLRVGGINGLSAYLADESFGRALAKAQLEYRHLFTTNLSANLFHAAWLAQLSGAMFGGVATVSNCEDYDGWFERNSWYAQAGYGLMASVRVLGVTPQLVRLDAAIPLSDRWRQRTCLGETFPGYLAEVQGLPAAAVGRLFTDLSISLTFTQPF